MISRIWASSISNSRGSDTEISLCLRLTELSSTVILKPSWEHSPRPYPVIDFINRNMRKMWSEGEQILLQQQPRQKFSGSGLDPGRCPPGKGKAKPCRPLEASLLHQFRYVHRGVRESKWGCFVSRPKDCRGSIACQVRFAVRLDGLVQQVDNPDLWNSCTAIGGELSFPIITERSVGDLNQQKHIRRTRMTSAIKIVSTFEQHQIRFRFRVFLQMDRVLDRDQPAPPCMLIEMMIQAFGDAAMGGTDGGYINDFSIEQFNPRLRAEDAGFSHPIIILCGEPMLCEHCHKASLPNYSGICKFSFAAACATSLSPRPLRFTMTRSFGFIRGARWMTSAMAWALSRAGIIPS